MDSRGSILEYSIRSGSRADRSVFLESGFGKVHASIIPKGMFILADAGYTLSERMITPYPTGDDAPPEHVLFNKLHSKTRMPVERAFGALKGRWRILNKTLESTNIQTICKVIRCCILLHNLTLNLGDVEYEVNKRIDKFSSATNVNTLEQSFEEDPERRNRGVAKRENILSFILARQCTN